MPKKSKPMSLPLAKISLGFNVVLVIAIILLANYVHSLSKDIELNRLKENITMSSLGNLQECYKHHDKTCPENKHVDATGDRQALQDFFTRN